jgi:hypothetical protein
VKAWHKDGPTRGNDPPGVEDALRRLHEGRAGAPTEDDRPPVSTLPMTKAARAAIQLGKKGDDARACHLK